MLLIAIPTTDVALLNSDGCHVTINGKPTVLRREDDNLCYGNNRCMILAEHDSGELTQFFAASHGMEDEPHAIIWPS